MNLSSFRFVIGVAVAMIAAAAAWVMFMSPSEDPARASKAVAGKAAPDGLPPMRALPPPGTDLLPPMRTPLSEKQQSAAPSTAAPEPSLKAAPALAVTPAPAAAEKTAPPVQTAKRAEKPAAESASALVSAGRYVGNVSGGESAGLTLVISSVEGGVVKGTAAVTGGGPCDDNYPVQGNARGGKLELRATRMGGRASDCPLSLSLAVDGNRMTGSTGSGGSVQLLRR